MIKLIFCIIVWMVAGCQLFQKPNHTDFSLREKIRWEGKSATLYSFDSSSESFELRDSVGLYSPLRSHHFEFDQNDTIRLTLFEFKKAYYAYSIFTTQVNSTEFEEGLFRKGTDLFFFHDKFIGIIHYTKAELIPIHFLKSNLVFQGDELFKIPSEFQSFPISGRISKSERVIESHFMGKSWHGPVFSIQIRCNQDTATAFRAEVQSPESLLAWQKRWILMDDSMSYGKENHFVGQNELQEPLVFWVFPTGILGILGCYDPVLAQSFAEKMQKMTILLPKP